MTNTILFELGTEELPARFIPNLLKQLESQTDRLLNEYRIEYENLKTMATPRRLTVMVYRAAETQTNSSVKKRGPSKDIAFDDDGKATKAAQGFAAGQGVNSDDLILEEVEGKKYVYAVRQIVGRPTSEVLPELFQSLMESLNLPVRMFWNDKQHKFLRPVRWLLCLYGSEVVNLSYAGVKSSNVSRGHRFLAAGDIEINKADDYIDVMRDSWVMVDHEEREQHIKKQVENLADYEGAVPEIPKDLLEEVNFLVEWPTALVGSYSEEFLDLPKEVLVRCMQEHQKFFGLVDKQNHEQLIPKFITVRNGDDTALDQVKIGNERVLRARLADARFFFEEDTKDSLETKVDELESIVYKEKLGSVYKKVSRMEELSETLMDILELTEPVYSVTQRTIKLSKADLTTLMVDEFPALQGLMGEKYARMDGENEDVCKGISEHYLPKHAGDALPQTMVGTVASIVDKVDNIASSFAIGERPSGSQDPYALRRQSLGIVQIILETELNFSLEQVVYKALSLISEQALNDEISNILDEIMEFFKLRVKTAFRDRGIPNDVVDSVLAVERGEIYRMYLRAEYLYEHRHSDEISSINTSYTRVKNLAGKATGDEVSPELLQEEAEKLLYNKYLNANDVIVDSLKKDEIEEAVTEMANFQEYIDQFFDNVMVMVDDRYLQNNRLNLIYGIKQMYNQFADFSLLQD